MNDAQLTAALRRTLADVADSVPVPDPPTELDRSAPGARGPWRGGGVLLAAASVLLVIGAAVVVAGLAGSAPAPPATPEPSPTATVPPGPAPPRVLVVDGDTLRYGDAAVDTGLPTPLIGAGGPSAAVFADAAGTVWLWNHRESDVSVAELGANAITAPRMRPR